MSSRPLIQLTLNSPRSCDVVLRPGGGRCPAQQEQCADDGHTRMLHSVPRRSQGSLIGFIGSVKRTVNSPPCVFVRA